MPVSVDYAKPVGGGYPPNAPVNYHFDTDSVTILSKNDPLVVAFVSGGGVIGAYQPPPPPDTSAQDRRDAFKADANYQTMLAQLKSATPAQVSAYITNNVTDLASARAMLVKFALVLALVLALVANGS